MKKIGILLFLMVTLVGCGKDGPLNFKVETIKKCPIVNISGIFTGYDLDKGEVIQPIETRHGDEIRFDYYGNDTSYVHKSCVKKVIEGDKLDQRLERIKKKIEIEELRIMFKILTRKSGEKTFKKHMVKNVSDFDFREDYVETNIRKVEIKYEPVEEEVN